MKKIIAAMFVTAVLLFGGTAPVYAADAATETAKGAVCEGISGQAGGTCGTGGASISSILETTLEILSIIAGIAAVVMIIVGGLKYITSGGDSSSISSAKNTIIYAVIGLIFVALAQFIVRFVLNSAQ